MTAPVQALPTADGTSTAVLAQPSGFGEAFGGAFGGWVTVVGAVLTGNGVSTAALLPAAATATLASDGVSTALASEVPVFAELQLV